jgi:hypothetical protein
MRKKRFKSQMNTTVDLQAGIYNGALGSVFGFLFPGNDPATAVPSESRAIELGLDRTPAAEMPIVLVRMDRHDDKGYTGDQYFKDADGRVIAGYDDVVPFTVANQAMNKDGVSRFQIPIAPAHACTIHSSQVQNNIQVYIMLTKNEIYVVQ